MINKKKIMHWIERNGLVLFPGVALAMFGLMILAVGCMGIQAPILPDSMMKANAPVQPNPMVYVTPNYNPVPAITTTPIVNATGNETGNTTVVTVKTPKPKPRYVDV